MTAEKDPRIEAVAKLLFTSPIYQHNAGDWDTDRSDYYYDRRMCLMAAEDVLRGIDEAAGVAGPWTAMEKVTYICPECGQPTETAKEHEERHQKQYESMGRYRKDE